MRTLDSRKLRRNFVAGLVTGLRVVWPILSGLLGLIITAGLVVGFIEDWLVQDSIYFAFVSGLTIGYGDLAPNSLLGRVLAITMCEGRSRHRRYRASQRRFGI